MCIAPAPLQDLEKASEEWAAWCAGAAPERAAMPGDWGRAGEFRRLLLLRALRPDRITNALQVGAPGGGGPWDLKRIVLCILLQMLQLLLWAAY